MQHHIIIGCGLGCAKAIQNNNLAGLNPASPNKHKNTSNKNGKIIMKSNDFLKDLDIDKYNLDEELIRHPQLYISWALESAEASKDKDQAKKDFDLVKAEVESKIRSDPKRYGIDKVTEGAVRSAIALHPKTKKYDKIYLKALHNERVLSKIEKAFGHRKSSLEGLVQLDLRLRFVEPKTPKQHKLNKEEESMRTRKLNLRKLKRSRLGRNS